MTRGFRPMKDVGKPVFNMLNEMRDPLKFIYSTDDIQGIRKVLGNIAKTSAAKNFGRGTEDRAAALEATNMIDDFMANLKPPDIASNAGSLGNFLDLMKNARGNYAASMRSGTIDDMLDRATRQAAKSGKGANIDNATRQRIDSIINNPKLRMQYTTQELDAMREIVQGTFEIGRAHV